MCREEIKVSKTKILLIFLSNAPSSTGNKSMTATKNYPISLTNE